MMGRFIELTGRKFKDKILFPVEKIGPMYNVKGDPSENEVPYTSLTCDGSVYKVLETKEEIIKRIGAEVI